MTNNKLDFEAAKEWATVVQTSRSFSEYENLAACYLALLQKTETLKAALEKIVEGDFDYESNDETTCARQALAEFEEIK